MGLVQDMGVLCHRMTPTQLHEDQAMHVQEAVLRFVLDAVRAETFNDARTLFLFGSYTIGKERLFLEVARQLGKKARKCPFTNAACRSRPDQHSPLARMI